VTKRIHVHATTLNEKNHAITDEQKKQAQAHNTARFRTTLFNARQIIPKDPRHPTVPQSYSHWYRVRCTAPPEAVDWVGPSFPPNHVVNRRARHQPVSSQEAIHASAGEHVHTSQNTYIVRSIAMVVNATKERRCGVPTNVLREKMPSTRVLVQEVRNIVDETSNADQWPRLCLLLIYIPCVHSIMVTDHHDSDVQLSQLITCRWLLSDGHDSNSWVSRRRFSCIVSWPLRTSLSGNDCETLRQKRGHEGIIPTLRCEAIPLC